MRTMEGALGSVRWDKESGVGRCDKESRTNEVDEEIRYSQHRRDEQREGSRDQRDSTDGRPGRNDKEVEDEHRNTGANRRNQRGRTSRHDRNARESQRHQTCTRAPRRSQDVGGQDDADETDKARRRRPQIIGPGTAELTKPARTSNIGTPPTRIANESQDQQRKTSLERVGAPRSQRNHRR